MNNTQEFFDAVQSFTESYDGTELVVRVKNGEPISLFLSIDHFGTMKVEPTLEGLSEINDKMVHIEKDVNKIKKAMKDAKNL